MGSDTHETSPERAVLLSRLSGQRAHVLAQLEGLSDERYWFEVVVAGDPLDFWPEGDDGDWQVGPDESATAVIEAYRSAIARSDEIIAARRFDDAPRRPEDWCEGLRAPRPGVAVVRPKSASGARSRVFRTADPGLSAVVVAASAGEGGRRWSVLRGRLIGWADRPGQPQTRGLLR